MDEFELRNLIENAISNLEKLGKTNLLDIICRTYIVDDLMISINDGFQAYVSQTDFDLGFEEGRDSGHEEGYQQGYEEGFEDGKEYDEI